MSAQGLYHGPAGIGEMTSSPLLTIIVPAFNESRFIQQVLQRLLQMDLPDGMRREVLVVDDGSTDGTAALVREIASNVPCVRLERHQHNQGKGAAIRTGLRSAAGDYVGLQDADLEIDPEGIPKLLAPLLDREADVMLGSRFSNARSHPRPRWRYAGNWFATRLNNLLNGSQLTDVLCGQKVMTRAVVEDLNLREDRFGIEAEIVAKLVRGGWRVREVPVDYLPRNHQDGKKIRLRDGFDILSSVVRHNLPGILEQTQ